jgi:hypothetical protein
MLPSLPPEVRRARTAACAYACSCADRQDGHSHARRACSRRTQDSRWRAGSNRHPFPLGGSEEGRLTRTKPTPDNLGTDMGIIKLDLTRKNVEDTPIRPWHRGHARACTWTSWLEWSRYLGQVFKHLHAISRSSSHGALYPFLECSLCVL